MASCVLHKEWSLFKLNRLLVKFKIALFQDLEMEWDMPVDINDFKTGEDKTFCIEPIMWQLMDS